MKKCFDIAGAIILGMHDAIVSLLGLIAGLYFAFTNTNIIILSCIISSVTASLSMGAANYLAVKTSDKNYALRAAIYTGVSYMTTCILLILPLLIFYNRNLAIFGVFIMAILIIYFFNLAFYRNKQFHQHFFEMLTICFTVSLVAFCIGEFAKIFLDI